MTRPGPDSISACPHCGEPARTSTYSSIAFYGSSTWSDGARLSFPGFPSTIVACMACHRCFREDDAAPVASAEPWDDDGARQIQAQWGDLPYIREPDESEYYLALARGDFPATPEAQREVRLRAWWKRNQPARTSTLPRLDAASLSPEARQNLEALLTLLSADDEQDLLLKAEVYRELGRFTEATQVLQALPSTATALTVQRLLALCDAGDSQVTELAADGWFSTASEMRRTRRPPDPERRSDEESSRPS